MTVVPLLVWLLLIVLVFGLIWLVVSNLPLPPPYNQIASALVLIIFLLIVLTWLVPHIMSGPWSVPR